MKQKNIFLLVAVCFLAGCACTAEWSLHSNPNQAVSKRFIMDACTDYLFDNNHIKREDYQEAARRANHLLKTADNYQLRECHIIGSASVGGRYTSLGVECPNLIRLPRHGNHYMIIGSE